MDEKLLARIEAIAVAQKTSPRAIMEQLFEKGLPSMEDAIKLNGTHDQNINEKNKQSVSLDDMLEAEAMAVWFKLKRRDLDEKQRAGKIPGFKISPKIIRYHPRTIIAKLAKDAGVSIEIIAASFGLKSRLESEN